MYKRLFIAIKINPTEELLRRIYFLKSNLKHELVNWIREDHYHLTLRFLGKVNVDRIDDVSGLMKTLLEKQEKFAFQVGELGVFGSTYNPRVLWLGIDEQKKTQLLYREIAKALNTIGFRNDGQNFVPHISIARIKKMEDKNFFQSVLNKYEKGFVEEQTLNEIILYESILGSKGAEYNVIDRFELKDKV